MIRNLDSVSHLESGSAMRRGIYRTYDHIGDSVYEPSYVAPKIQDWPEGVNFSPDHIAELDKINY